MLALALQFEHGIRVRAAEMLRRHYDHDYEGDDDEEECEKMKKLRRRARMLRVSES